MYFVGLAETVYVEGTICSLSHSADFVVVINNPFRCRKQLL